MEQLLINNISRHVSLTAQQIAVVPSFFTLKKFRKRQYILQEGDTVRYESFITKGVTRTYEVDEKGQEHIIQFGLEDWWVGDLFGFLTGTATIYHIDCLEDTEVLQITKENLEILYAQVPAMERYFRILVQKAFIASTRRLSATLSKTAQERYENFINHYPEIEQRVPNHQIASYLGITPQSLSRIRSQLQSRTP